MVRWPSEAVDRQPVPTASEGHRTEPQIVTGCGMVASCRVARWIRAWPIVASEDCRVEIGAKQRVLAAVDHQ